LFRRPDEFDDARARQAAEVGVPLMRLKPNWTERLLKSRSPCMFGAANAAVSRGRGARAARVT